MKPTSLARVITPPHVEKQSLQSEIFADELNLFSYLPFNPKPESPPVLFGSNSWDFTTAVEWPASQQFVRMIWGTIVDPVFALTCKEAAVLLMQPGAAIHLGVTRRRRRPVSPWSLYYTTYYFWVKWLNWLTEQGVESLAEVTQNDCEVWLQQIVASSRNHAVGALRVFADYRAGLTTKGYAEGFRPFGEKTASEVTGGQPAIKAENKTPLIPDSIFSPLLASALFAVQEIGPRFLQLQESTEEIGTPIPLNGYRTGWLAGTAVDDALNNYLTTLREAGRGVPSVDGEKPSLHRIAADIGIAGGAALRKPHRLNAITAATEQLGLEPGTGPRKRQALSDTLLQIFRGENPQLGTQATDNVAWFLGVSALITVASLTGMRTSELATITDTSIEKEEIASGLNRYRIKAKKLKGEKMGGKVEYWLTVKEAAEAIHLAASLPGAQPRQPLFRTLAPRFDEYVAVANEIALAEKLPLIPEGWDLYLRQFRRKVSREMAYRNFGIIAAMRALKHQSVLTTEGYAGAKGGALASLQREIETQREEVNFDEITRIYRGITQGESVAGLGGKALKAAFEQAKTALSQGAGTVREDDIIAHVMRGFGKNLHTGPVAHCWFRDPALARCLKNTENKEKPLVGLCNPVDCPNATIHPQHSEVWLGNLTSLENSLKDKRVPAGEKERLKPKAEKMRRFIEELNSPHDE